MDKGKGKGKIVIPQSYKNIPGTHEYDDSSSSHHKYPKPSYKVFSPYIRKPHPLHICYLDHSIELLQFEDPTIIASTILLPFSYFPIVSKKTRYYYELILQDIDFVFLSINSTKIVKLIKI